MAWNPSKLKREKMPSSCFLKPEQRKYPWKVKRDGKWVPSKSQLRAAISCANRAEDKSISRKAQSLYKRYFK